MRLLLIEDDVQIAESLGRALRSSGNVVDVYGTARDAEQALRAVDYALVILDLGLPDRDGGTLLRAMRAQDDHTPVLVLTARDAVPDRIRGLDLGADDYVVKPVDLHELGARLRSLVRRAHGQLQGSLRSGAVVLEPAARRVSLNGQAVALSTREFDLLHALMRNAGRVLSREQLEEQLYSWGHEVDSNAVEVHIHHLRRKLQPDLIQTVRGVGYVVLRDMETA